MKNVTKQFGVAILPEPELPTVGYEILQEEIRIFLRAFKSFDATRSKVYLHRLAFRFSDDNPFKLKPLSARLDRLVCRLQIPKKVRGEKMEFLNHWFGAQPLQIQDHDGVEIPNPKGRVVRIDARRNHINYDFDVHNINKINQLIHTLVIRVDDDVDPDQHYLRLVATAHPTAQYRQIMELRDEVKSSTDVILRQERQIRLFDQSKYDLPDINSYHAFLAYSSADLQDVLALSSRMRRRGLKVWLDEDDMFAGDVVLDKLDSCIRNSKCLIILIGRSGIGPWQKIEVGMAIQGAVKRHQRVIPVLLPGAREMGHIPPYLSNYSWVDLSGGLDSKQIEKIERGIFAD